MKRSVVFGAVLFLMGASAFAACPKSNSTMQVKEGVRNGQKFCAIRSTDATKPAEILEDTKFTSDYDYIVASGLYVGKNNMMASDKGKIKLTIEAGTKIKGASQEAYVQINRGAQIFAEGTADAPIVFTTTKTKGRTRGSWGGLIINGSAPVNGCAEDVKVCELRGEGLTTYKYGGSNVQDNSGVLKYVVVEFAGNAITPDNELNGIAFQGVGNKTEVDYIQVHMNADDGVEFFGGTVDVKHVVLTGNLDDSLDWTNGWVGSAQYIIVEQYSDAGNHGIEADNFKKQHDATPRSQPTLSNMTFIGSDKSQGAKGGSGILLRRGTGAHIYNSYITGFSESCFDMDDNETFNHALNGEGVKIVNTYFDCDTTFTPVEKQEPWSIDQFVISENSGNMMQSLDLVNYVPSEGSNLVEVVEILDADETDYVGAVRDSSDRWFEGWVQTSND